VVQISVIEEDTGRPTKLTESIAADICDGLATGLNNGDVADLVGVHYDTLRVWMQEPAFAKRIAAAKAFRKRVWLKRIADGGPGWQGVCWIVQRMYCQEWGNHLLYQQPEPGEKNVTEALLDTLANYHALKNGKSKEQAQEAIREVPSGDSEQS
jgi:hypothetical protein